MRAGEAKAYSTLQTADGSPMRVGYSTSTSGQWHTGTQVPIAAKGPQAANILGTLDQTELYQVLKGLAPAGTDVEAPVTTATVAPAANANGWNTTVPVTITLSATDATAVASTEFRLNGGAWTPYSAPIQVAAAGTTSVEFRSTDSAGNVETIRSRDVKIDSTAPTATVALNPAAPGAGGTYSTPVRVTLTGADAGGSGIDKVEYRFGTGAWSTYAGPFTVYTNGEHAIEYRPVDVAGNVGTAATVRFTTAGLSGTPASCAASSSDEFDGSAVDPKWSVLRPTASRYSVTGGKLQIRFDGTNSDLNGTTASATNQFLQPAPTGGPWTATTKLDMTDAKMQSNQVGFVLWQAEGSGANRFAKIVVNSRTTDASAPSRPSWWVERQVTLNSSASGAGNGNAGYIVGAVPDTVFLRVASSGGAVQTLRTYYSLDGIAWTEFLTPFTMDTTSIPLRVGLGTFRGENNPNGFARFDWFRVCDFSLDDTAPQSSASVAPAAGGSGWHTTSPVTVTLTADDGAGTGIASTEYRIGGGAWTTYTAPFTVAASAVIDYRSTDVRGNVEPAKTQELRIDAVAPVSTATLDPASPSTTPVTVRLAATDAGSGVGRIEYTLDGGGTWSTYAAASPPVISAVGSHTVGYRAVDVAGNVETARNVTVTIGTATPTPTPTATPTTPTATPTDSVDAQLDVIAVVVPRTLSLTLGSSPVNLGPFIPGVEREYTASTFLTATSSLPRTQLIVDLPGYMTNGALALPEPLRVELSKTSWTGPFANDRVDATFKQLVKRTDRLLEGTYAKQVRFTLTATTP